MSDKGERKGPIWPLVIGGVSIASLALMALTILLLLIIR